MNQKTLLQQLFIETVKFAVVSILFILNPALTSIVGAISSSFITLIAYVIYLFVTFIKNICKPLKIIVELRNYVTGTNETSVFAHSTNSEPERTVKLRVYIKKTKSIFSWISILLIRNKLCFLDINTVPRNYFTLIPETNYLIIRGQYGFKINLTEIFNQLLRTSDSIIDREFTFVIAENRDADINNKCEVDIIPHYIINDKRAGFIHFIIYDVEIDKHHVRFFINYNGLQWSI